MTRTTFCCGVQQSSCLAGLQAHLLPTSNSDIMFCVDACHKTPERPSTPSPSPVQAHHDTADSRIIPHGNVCCFVVPLLPLQQQLLLLPACGESNAARAHIVDSGCCLCRLLLQLTRRAFFSFCIAGRAPRSPSSRSGIFDTGQARHGARVSWYLGCWYSVSWIRGGSTDEVRFEGVSIGFARHQMNHKSSLDS